MVTAEMGRLGGRAAQLLLAAVVAHKAGKLWLDRQLEPVTPVTVESGLGAALNADSATLNILNEVGDG